MVFQRLLSTSMMISGTPPEGIVTPVHPIEELRHLLAFGFPCAGWSFRKKKKVLICLNAVQGLDLPIQVVHLFRLVTLLYLGGLTSSRRFRSRLGRRRWQRIEMALVRWSPSWSASQFGMCVPSGRDRGKSCSMSTGQQVGTWSYYNHLAVT